TVESPEGGGFEGQSPRPISRALNESLIPHDGFSLESRFPPSSLSRYGQFDEARLRRELSALEEQHGDDHPETLDTLQQLGLLLIEQGRYRSAEDTIRRLLLIHRKKNGDSHSQTANSLSLLGTVLLFQGHFGGAEKLLKRARTILTESLGPTHPSTLITI